MTKRAGATDNRFIFRKINRNQKRKEKREKKNPVSPFENNPIYPLGRSQRHFMNNFHKGRFLKKCHFGDFSEIG